MAIPLFDVTVKGVALLDKGLTEWDAIDGVGLQTYGFVWGCPNIWYHGCIYDEFVTLTAWTLSAFPGATTTIWTAYNVSLIPTVWTPYSTEGIEEC